MSDLLITYASSEGQTAKVAEFMAEAATEGGHSVDRRAIGDLPADPDLGSYDGVLVGASIHMGRHQKAARRFVADNAAALNATHSAFFQVCLSSAVDEPDQHAEAAGYIEDLLAASGWEPERVASFGGALRFSEYGFFKTRIMKAIAGEFAEAASADYEPGADAEFTDWTEVEAFLEGFLALVAGEAPAAPEPEAED